MVEEGEAALVYGLDEETLSLGADCKTYKLEVATVSKPLGSDFASPLRDTTTPGILVASFAIFLFCSLWKVPITYFFSSMRDTKWRSGLSPAFDEPCDEREREG